MTLALPRPVGRQFDVVYMPSVGHHVVLGTAGTGKTTMALHRAVHLSSPTTVGHGPTLLVSFTNSLVGYLSTLLAGVTQPVTAQTFHTFARGYLNSRGLMTNNGIADKTTRRQLIGDALDATRHELTTTQFLSRPHDFFLDELEWIDGQGLTDKAAYLQAQRIGRTAALQDPQRRAVWRVRKHYQKGLANASKQYDWYSLATAVRDSISGDHRPRMYRHIVVDEAQDLSPEDIRSLVEVVHPGGSVTLFADYAQQIYGQRLSWQSVGLSVTKVEPFVDNYRNTPEIARLAIAMSNLPYFKDTVDLVEPQEPARAAGSLPVLIKYDNIRAECDAVQAAIAGSGAAQRVAVLARTQQEARDATAGVSGIEFLYEDQYKDRTGPGVYAGTYHSAKGLEFDVVILPFCGTECLPAPYVINAFGLAEAQSREGRLLYVGITRARSELAITYTGTLTPLLPPISSGLYAP